MLIAIPASGRDVATLVTDDNLLANEFITGQQLIGLLLDSRLTKEEIVASQPESQVIGGDGAGRKEEEVADENM